MKLFNPMLILLTIFLLTQNIYAVEKISVIGSHIKRIQMEGPSPILIIDRHQIEVSPHQSVADLLRDLPAATGGGARGVSLHANSSFTSTSLRGMGGGEVLVLINKIRIVPAGGGSAVDLNVFPLVAVERIEILKDGSSALYGADAIGGVINIVTRKNYKGLKASFQTSLAQREEGNTLSGIASFVDFLDWKRKDFSGKGDQFNVEAVYGGSQDSINYLLAGQLRLHTPLYYRDRSFAHPRKEHFSPFGSPGSWTADEINWNPAPGCPQDKVTKHGCVFDFTPYPQITSQEINAKAFLHLAKPLSSGTLESQTIYSLIRPFSVLAPAPDVFEKAQKPGDADYRIPSTVFNNLLQQAGAAASASGPVTMRYRMVDEKGAGPRKSIDWNHFLQTQLRLLQPLKNTLEFEGNVAASGYYYKNTGYNYLKKDILFNRLKDGSFNPLLAKDKKSDVSKAKYTPTTDTFSGLVSMEPRLSGELLEIKGQPILFATGALAGWQYYSKESDVISQAGKQWGGGVKQTGSGHRGFGSIYGELSALLVNRLEMQLAARTDYYQGFNLAWQEWKLPFTETSLTFPFSPKMALSLHIAKSLKLRASWGLGFKVPPLEALFSDEIVSHPFAVDRKLCPDKYEQANPKDPKCTRKQYKTFIRSNPTLNPELTESLNIGIVFEPVKTFSISMDYYGISQRGGAGALTAEDIFRYETKYGIEKLKKLNMNVTRLASGEAESIVASAFNSSRAKVHGIDFDIVVHTTLNKGWLAGLKLEHSHLLYIESQATKELPIESPVPFHEWMQDLFGLENGEKNRKNNVTYPGAPRWRNRASFSLRNNDIGQEYQVILHNIPSQLQTKNSSADEVVPFYWQVDLFGLWDLNKKSELSFGIRNILGMDRPQNPKQYRAAGYLNADLYSLRGRTLNMKYTQRF